MKLTITKIKTEDELEAAFKIRKEVFVFEQNVDPEEEYDEFESESHHFLAKLGNHPVGTARWRRTSEGFKLERFAVLISMRGKGIGIALVEAVLEDLKSFAKEVQEDPKVYMHAQLHAKTFYEKFGFKKVGETFTECRISHVKMEKHL
ncbi:GNAT family N-acetyltransferase [Echinicola jeungdonensis]|uniref:GNAT family N-acetyltransferase n=1 Tax=Echinicola jeungdonensis TaxID=709343 RepID=A0ABV5J2R1_9BACT|nr:GNAT family N-acetyltransferase [Echinicola jeungdonensis]MDN3668433.1 GNAT family N-acetyltransferase [Echinicola jeungdonensis]